MEHILVQFDQALAELTRATVINVESIPLLSLIKEIQDEDPSNDFIMELEDPQRFSDSWKPYEIKTYCVRF